MIRIPTRLPALIVMGLIGLMALVGSSDAEETASDLRKQQEKNQSLIDDARKEQKKIEAELKRLGDAARTAEEQFKRTELELRRAEHEVTIQKGQVFRAREELSGISGAIQVSTNSMEEQQRRLRGRSRKLFGLALTADCETLLRPGELAHIEAQVRALEVAARIDAGLVRASRARREQLQEEKDVKEVLLARLSEEERRLKVAFADVESKKKELQLLKTRIAKKTTETRSALEKTRSMIASTIQTMVKTQARLKTLEKKYASLAGKFPRPVDGEFFQPPELSHMDGVYIKARLGSPVKTIQAGEVLSIQELRGVGITVIVGHGDNYTSSYSNLSTVSVKEGQSLKNGQLIGKSGRSPYGEMIFFSIFHNQSPVNARERLN